MALTRAHALRQAPYLAAVALLLSFAPAVHSALSATPEQALLFLLAVLVADLGVSNALRCAAVPALFGCTRTALSARLSARAAALQAGRHAGTRGACVRACAHRLRAALTRPPTCRHSAGDAAC
jgi:hypothetical protein